MLQINESTLVGIADAIRGKEGSTEPIPTVDMAERIANLPSEDTPTDNTVRFHIRDDFNVSAYDITNGNEVAI